jgi:hypothetical protein
MSRNLMTEPDSSSSDQTMAIENIYQMFMRHGRVGFFVKRNSWSHPYTAAAAGNPCKVGPLTRNRAGPLREIVQLRSGLCNTVTFDVC